MQGWTSHRPAGPWGGLEYVAAQILILDQGTKVLIDEGGIDDMGLPGVVRGLEGDVFHQLFHHGMQTTRPDIFSALVDLPGRLGDTTDPLLGELYGHRFGGHQSPILFGQ